MRPKWWKVTFTTLVKAETEEEAIKWVEENKEFLTYTEIKYWGEATENVTYQEKDHDRRSRKCW